MPPRGGASRSPACADGSASHSRSGHWGADLRTDAVVPLVHEKVVQGIATDVEGVLLDPRERSLIDVDTT
ncbi:hypothetical protein GCM10010234_51020 [Streptomyces hawaiiensis]|uniref:hypothetical protein n=1 Tax=Streptomyces hawaiiensis TaxID=67305 RepID=UPI0031E2A5CE